MCRAEVSKNEFHICSQPVIQMPSSESQREADARGFSASWVLGRGDFPFSH